jgi:hypothetical protein
MKATLFSLLSLLLSSFGHVCLAQNWAPFQINKKILYSTPDSLGGMLVGKSLALIWVDSTSTQGDSIIYYRKDMLNPNLNIAPFGDPKSLTSLYGLKMTKRGNKYRFYPANTNEQTIQYFPEAKTGNTILHSQNWHGIVVNKISRIVNGQPDSIKIIQLTETPDFGLPETYEAEVSRENGFLLIPNLFQWGPSFQDRRDSFQYFGNYDDDVFGIKSFQMAPIPYLQGDVLIAEYSTSTTIWNTIYTIVDSVKTVIANVMGDSCLIIDSIKRTEYPSGFQFIPPSVTRKIKNQPLSYRRDSILASTPLSTQKDSWIAKSAFLTKDSVLFVGSLPCNRGWNDGPSSLLVSTRLPIARSYGYSFTDGSGGSPISFTRGNIVTGWPGSIVFTTSKSLIENLVSVYPNPGKEKIRIQGIKKPSVITLHNMQGKVILEQSISSDSEIDVQLIPRGLYYLTIRTGNKQQSLKWVKE